MIASGAFERQQQTIERSLTIGLQRASAALARGEDAGEAEDTLLQRSVQAIGAARERWRRWLGAGGPLAAVDDVTLASEIVDSWRARYRAAVAAGGSTADRGLLWDLTPQQQASVGRYRDLLDGDPGRAIEGLRRTRFGVGLGDPEKLLRDLERAGPRGAARRQRLIEGYAAAQRRERQTMDARTQATRLASQTLMEEVEVRGGRIETRQWVSRGDDRVRPSHAEADGQRVEGTAPFSVGGIPMAYPGDPAGGEEQTVGCRCVMRVRAVDAAGRPYQVGAQQIGRETRGTLS